MKKILLSFLIVVINTSIFANEEENITEIVQQWNEIHNTREVEKFKDIYADEVLFYGRNYSANTCYQRKKAFLTPAFYQEIISPLTFTYYTSGFIKCSFTKRVRFKKSVKEHFCYLLIRKLGNKYLISGESDLLTDENLNVNLDLGIEKRKNNKSILLYGFGIALLMGSGVVVYKRKQNKKYTSEIKLDIDKSEGTRNLVDDNLANVKFIYSSETIEKTKGDRFEKYVVERFRQEYFKLLEWRSDKYHEGRYAISNKKPDLEFNFRTNYHNFKFAVECKWRKDFYNEKIEWAKDYQLKNYREYSIQNKIAVFVIIGVGGEPDNPEFMYIIPLNEINLNILSKYQLKKYQRFRRNDFFLYPESMTLQ